MRQHSAWEIILAGLIALLVIFWFSPGILSSIRRGKRATPDWPAALTPLGLAALFVLLLILPLDVHTMHQTDSPLIEAEQYYAIRPNKSEIKRENAALEALGEELIALPKERLDQLALPTDVSAAVTLAQSIEKHHGAFKRQRKYIAKLLRGMDIAALRGQLERHGRQTAEATRQQHAVERWRDRLLDGDEQALNQLMAEHQDADRQKLRQLIRDARKERLTDGPPRSARLLFKYLRELMSSSGPSAETNEQ